MMAPLASLVCSLDRFNSGTDLTVLGTVYRPRVSFLSDSDGGNNRFLLRYCLDENRMRRGADGFFRRGDFRGCLRFGNCLKRKRKPDGFMGYFLGYSRFFSEKYDILLSENTGKNPFYSGILWF